MMTENYVYIPRLDSVVFVEIEFKDTEGENKGRRESFFFTLPDWDEWVKSNEEALERFCEKYHVSIAYGRIIHSPEYIMGIYNK